MDYSYASEHSPFHPNPTACSEQPWISRDEVFKELLVQLSQDMSSEDVSALAYLFGSRGARGSMAALDVLKTLVRQGEFSARSCGKLEVNLRKINRCDLAENVRRYMESYPEPSKHPTTAQENDPHSSSATVNPGLPITTVHGTVDKHLSLQNSSFKQRQETVSPEPNHKLFDTLTGNQNMSENIGLFCDLQSREMRHSYAQEIPSRGDQSTHTRSGEYNSYGEDIPGPNIEGYEYSSQSANHSREGSDYSFTSSLSKASMHKASEILHTAMDVVVRQSQEQLWYHSTSSVRIPQSDNSSVISGPRENPWEKKQSQSFHGRHSAKPPTTATVKRAPSAPARNREEVYRPKTSCQTPNHGDPELVFPASTPNEEQEEEQLTMKPVRRYMEDSLENLTPREQMNEHWDESPVSNGVTERFSTISEATSENTLTSPRTSISGRETTDIPEHVKGKNESIAKATSPPPSKEKQGTRKKRSLFRSKSRTSSDQSFTWKVEREKLIKPIWRHQTQEFITRSCKLELNANQGKYNPKLTFQLYPYGLHQDKGKAVTLAVRIATPEKCPPLPLDSEISLSLVVWDGEGKEVKVCPAATEKLSQLSTFCVYSVISHDQLKEARTKYFNLEVEVTHKGLERTS